MHALRLRPRVADLADGGSGLVALSPFLSLSFSLSPSLSFYLCLDARIVSGFDPAALFELTEGVIKSLSRASSGPFKLVFQVPLRSEHGCKTVMARFWPWLSDKRSAHARVPGVKILKETSFNSGLSGNEVHYTA